MLKISIKLYQRSGSDTKDFFENITLKTKSEVQEAHFSGKQYALDCSIVEPGEDKFAYHLNDDTTHDPCFVHQALEDIFDCWGIGNETVVIKSDNAPTQYKNKWAFQIYHSLAGKYNVCIIRLYGAASHRKGLVNAMSSFGVKSILRRDIIGLDVWFGNSTEMCDYLGLHEDPRISYSVISQAEVDKKRMARTEKKIDGCMIKHLFKYKPNDHTVFMKEFLCDCDNCLDFNFSECCRADKFQDQSQIKEFEEQAEFVDDCHLDEQQDYGQHVFAFVSVPSFVAVISYNSCEAMNDRYGHSLDARENYLKGNYLKAEGSHNMSLKKFSIVTGDVLCNSEKVFEVFVDIDHDNLSMAKDAYLEVVSRVS